MDILGYTELDPATGLHVTGTPQVIDVETYRLAVTGLLRGQRDLVWSVSVDHP